MRRARTQLKSTQVASDVVVVGALQVQGRPDAVGRAAPPVHVHAVARVRGDGVEEAEGPALRLVLRVFLLERVCLVLVAARVDQRPGHQHRKAGRLRARGPVRQSRACTRCCPARGAVQDRFDMPEKNNSKHFHRQLFRTTLQTCQEH